MESMSVKIIIINGDNEKEYDFNLSMTIGDLKDRIIKDFDITSKYIDLDFQLDRPIRSLGNFNIEPGILPRPLDIYTFDRFGMGGRKISIKYIEVDDYVPYVSRNNRNQERVKYDNTKGVESVSEDISFNIYSEDDFPKLE